MAQGSYRPRPNRRLQDPTNLNTGVQGCAMICETDQADPSHLNLYFNAAVDATLMAPEMVTIQGGAEAITFTQVNDKKVHVLCGDVVSDGQKVQVSLEEFQIFGPNIVGGNSSLYAEQV